MARDLAKKYRPKRLEQLIGQERAMDAVRRNLATSQPMPMLLAGPSGTGKTTVARIIGMTEKCEASDPPCGECNFCHDIWEHQNVFGFSEINGAKKDQPHHAKQMADYIDEPGLCDWVLFVDEAHRLSKAAMDVLLKPIEDPRRDKRIILATTEPRLISRALRSRCLLVPMLPLRASDLFGLLSSVASAEGIRCESKALDMIAAAADGSAREALQLLDAVADHGDVSCASTAEQLSLGTAGLVVRYFKALLEADAASQDDVLHEWSAEPPEITKLIRDFMLHLYNMEAAATRINDIVNPAFFEIVEGDRREIAAGFRSHAQRRSRPFADFLFDCLEQWEFDPSTVTDRSSLMIKIRRFDRLINGDDPGNPTPPTAAPKAKESGSKQRRRRAAKGESYLSGSSTNSLSLAQVEVLYDMSSFLAQEHGVLLNTKITIDQPLSILAHVKVPPLVSALTHALSLRTKDWSASPAHWVFVNSREGERLRTRIGLHLPPAALAKVETWLELWFASWRKENGVQDATFTLDAQNPDRAVGYNRNRIQRHWSIFRWLAGAVDPAAAHWPSPNATGERARMIELLKISSEYRYSLGELGDLNAWGSSRSLARSRRSAAAGDKMGFLSAFADCAWAQLTSGWELTECEDRSTEKRKRQESLERLALEYPPGNTVLERDHHRAALQKLKDSWPDDPRLRPRSWHGWWS